MTLRVGPYLYRVRFVDGLIDHEGQPCVGLCDNDGKVIYVSTTPCEAEQIQTICHEYMEAWIYHFGQRGDPSATTSAPSAAGDLLADPGKEAWCDLFGLAMTQFVLDWMHQLRTFAGDAHPAAGGHVAAAAVAPSPASGEDAPAAAPMVRRPGSTPHRGPRRRQSGAQRPLVSNPSRMSVRVQTLLRRGPAMESHDPTHAPQPSWRLRVFERADVVN